MLGLAEREQDLIHTAALLHDIGKFIFPDSILFADRKLTDEEWEIVKLHPEQGAKLVAPHRGLRPGRRHRPHHHERYDGGGYPSGIARRGDPPRLAHHRRGRHLRRDDLARLLPPPGQLRGGAGRAASRLRHPARPAGRRRRSCEMIEQHGVAFRHTDEADFERELAFERRVEDYARPRGRRLDERPMQSGASRRCLNQNERLQGARLKRFPDVPRLRV